MSKQAFLWFSLLMLALWGCGSPSPKSTTPNPASITISPTNVVAGSTDLTLTITGTAFAGPEVCSTCALSVAVWSANGSNTPLATNFVSGTQLTAIVPADLLTSPVSARVFVETLIGQEDSPRSQTTPVLFAVTALPLAPVTITSISPASAAAGSSDLTLTITGANFANYMSLVGWSTNPSDSQCCNVWLETTFVNSTQITAVVPAALLQTPVTAQLFVETGDPQGITDGVSYPRSNSVAFTVTQ